MSEQRPGSFAESNHPDARAESRFKKFHQLSHFKYGDENIALWHASRAVGHGNDFFVHRAEGADDSGSAVQIQTDKSGVLIWPSSKLMTSILLSRKEAGVQTYATAIELGSGTGLLGLSVAKLKIAEKVLLTDRDPEAVELVKQSIAENDLEECVDALQLDWCDDAAVYDILSSHPWAPFSVVLASDVLYTFGSKRIIEDFVSTSACLLGWPGTGGCGGGGGGERGEVLLGFMARQPTSATRTLAAAAAAAAAAARGGRAGERLQVEALPFPPGLVPRGAAAAPASAVASAPQPRQPEPQHTGRRAAAPPPRKGGFRAENFRLLRFFIGGEEEGRSGPEAGEGEGGAPPLHWGGHAAAAAAGGAAAAAAGRGGPVVGRPGVPAGEEEWGQGQGDSQGDGQRPQRAAAGDGPARCCRGRGGDVEDARVWETIFPGVNFDFLQKDLNTPEEVDDHSTASSQLWGDSDDDDEGN